MKIAVIGSGISGLSSAYFLSKKYKVDLYEKENHFGGHSFTYEIKENEKINGNIFVNLFLLNKVDAFTLGYLITMWEHRTFISSVMLSINPFDQFGVSAGKIYTKRYLEHKIES